MNRTLLGLILLAVVAAVAVGVSMLDLSTLTRNVTTRDPVSVSIYYGGEKSALLRNEKVQRILEGRYKITLQATKAGSVEMVTTLPVTGRDCLWPSNMVAVELARDSGRTVLGDETIFNSPIVFYAWSDVADALIEAGAVRAREDGFLAADVQAMGRLIEAGTRWKEDLGLNIYGPFKVFSTHPAKSNSGNIWSGLLATVFNSGQTPTQDSLPAVLPRVTAYFDAMGHMEASSGDIFENFLKQGMGARPIIVGYENQMVEFLAENAQYADLIRSKIRVLYPEPTIFASHPLISLTPACGRLAEALIDPELQAIAWADHGFRTGLIGVENDPADIGVARLPETVALVVPMPSAKVMEEIIEAVR
ncbi:hypothetical protein [Rhodovulum adriaticum]|uniref:Extracellular solute-binding protein n=1 Tax=Rhodovulum adriaticum TaxID=35804 RepID=A0A4R2NIK7_RHOAD|nr:hypothetical protein [Rhodovulum adriaticum]MBK1635406.1 hypothetical protein [Rhodovulum adriaticum]TCP21112.1 hypothetical protein EV656_11333 [Rhodovulum adriaticum]